VTIEVSRPWSLRPSSSDNGLVRDVHIQSIGAELSIRQNHEDGEPLLLLHGGPGVPDYMQASIAPMFPKFRCISFDQRGVGESTCRDGRYDLAAYLDDIERIRDSLGITSWNVMGHSWGGLLAQAYTAKFPQRTTSLVLSSSSLGVGRQWKRTKKESFRIERGRAGLMRTCGFYAYGAGLVLPGAIGRWSMRHIMTETWHNYFLDPKSAPDPDPMWLLGCSHLAMIKTDRAMLKERPDALDEASTFDGPVLVLYWAFDNQEAANDIVRRRFPGAQQVTLENSGHVHWINNPTGYAAVLMAFYQRVSEMGGRGLDPD